MAVKTVGDMKIGSRLIFGKYTVSKKPDDDPKEIEWLKAERNCAFITEYVIDYLCFDARERDPKIGPMRNCGNPDFDVSNIRQFLNSSAESGWFFPQHENDAAPDSAISSYESYADHSGFLAYFEEYEQDAIIGDVVLPHYEEVASNDINRRLSLFKRKGARAHASLDMRIRKHTIFHSTSWCPFYTSDPYKSPYNDETTHIIAIGRQGYGRDGYMDYMFPYTGCGIRPLLRIAPEKEVYEISDGVYALKETAKEFQVKDFKAFFGF